MPKRDVYKDEWYPVYTLSETAGDTDISPDFYARYIQVMEAFDEVQSELSDLYKK